MQPREIRAVSLGNAYRVDLESERHRWTLDEDEARGGTDAGPSPVESLLGALVSCLTVSFQFAARRKGVPIDRIEGWVAANEKLYLEQIAVELQVWSPADEAVVRALLPRAERGCFVKAALRADLPVTVDLFVYPSEQQEGEAATVPASSVAAGG